LVAAGVGAHVGVLNCVATAVAGDPGKRPFGTMQKMTFLPICSVRGRDHVGAVSFFFPSA
jgi:hypothetical protein